MRRVVMAVAMLAAAAAWGTGPGDYYLGGSESPGIFSPYWRTITVFGSVNTNDVLIFMDRTGAKVRGTNVIDQINYWALYAANEAALRVAGDLASSNNVTAVRAELTNTVRAIEDQTNTWNAALPPGATNGIPHASLSGVNGAGTLHVSAAETNKINTAWQNPVTASYWTWTSDGTNITLTGYTGPAAVVIPDTLDNLPVTGFVRLFQYNDAITSVSGGANITVLESGAFSGCDALKNVNLPNVATLVNGAFYGCSVLTNVNLPNAVTVGHTTFRHCPALTSVRLGQNAPAEEVDVYRDTLNVTNYVTNPQATGWGATWNGRPVVRLPVTSDLFAGSGTGLTNIPIAGVTGLQGALDGKLNTNGLTAPIIAAAGGQLAETVVTGAVVTVTSGNRYFFTTATNVTLSASLTGGQVVNYAALRNTATNAITATAESAGWKWTGGTMTNTIPANTMMTFGWACNPFTGATNAYATAASVN